MHTQDWLKASLMDPCSKKMWPPSSSECNTLDYFIVEREVNKHTHNTLASLKIKILDVMTNIDRGVIICACKKFRSLIESIVEASGDFIKLM
jgi:hypothetical protein